VLPGYLVEERGSVNRRREMAHLPGREEGLCHQVVRCLLLYLYVEGRDSIAGGALLRGVVKASDLVS
jgi:hypothetical protein